VRVLHLVDSLALGGAETLLATLTRAAPAANFTVRVAALAGRDDGRDVLHPALERAGAEPRFLDVRRLASGAALASVIAEVRRSRCDLVHTHLEYSAVLGTLAGRIARRPVVCTFHHVPKVLSRREAVMERIAVELAGNSSRAIFVSDAARRAFATRYRSRRTWTTVHNGIDVSLFRPQPADEPSRPWRRIGGPRVVLVAALREGKGHDTAIRSWASIIREHPDARLVLIGDGPEAPRLRALTERLGLGNSVEFAGMQHDVAASLATSDLALLPTEWEAYPTALLEAAAAGLPVVASAVGGVPEIVRHGTTGLLVPPGDHDALTVALLALLGDDLRRLAMGAAARRLADTEFDARVWAARLAAIYRDALGCPA
jgi:glycosyltransferase involved in cell wall biosynthesis